MCVHTHNIEQGFTVRMSKQGFAYESKQTKGSYS